MTSAVDSSATGESGAVETSSVKTAKAGLTPGRVASGDSAMRKPAEGTRVYSSGST